MFHTPPCRVAQGGSRPEESTFPWMEPEEEEDTGLQGEQVRPTNSDVVTLASFQFYLPFAFIIIHGSGRPAKNGEGVGAFIT